MSHRQLADEEGHRWDVEDEGPLNERQEGPEHDAVAHQLRFRRDDGDERVRSAPRSLDQMADVELRTLLEGGRVEEETGGPDLRAGDTGGYGDARD